MSKKLKFYIIIISGVAAGVFLGLALAFIQVYFWEMTDNGKYAVYEECVMWDEGCLDMCSGDADRFGQPVDCSSCCMGMGEVVVTLGERIYDVGSMYARLGALIGLVLGIFIANVKKNIWEGRSKENS